MVTFLKVLTQIIFDIIWPCLLIIMIMKLLFSGILFICALVVSFAALALRARAANDTTRAQINNIPSKSHVIPLITSRNLHQNGLHWAPKLQVLAVGVCITLFLYLSFFRALL